MRCCRDNNDDPELLKPENQVFRKTLFNKWHEEFNLSSVL